MQFMFLVCVFQKHRFLQCFEPFLRTGPAGPPGHTGSELGGLCRRLWYPCLRPWPGLRWQGEVHQILAPSNRRKRKALIDLLHKPMQKTLSCYVLFGRARQPLFATAEKHLQSSKICSFFFLTAEFSPKGRADLKARGGTTRGYNPALLNVRGWG